MSTNLKRHRLSLAAFAVTALAATAALVTAPGEPEPTPAPAVVVTDAEAEAAEWAYRVHNYVCSAADMGADAERTTDWLVQQYELERKATAAYVAEVHPTCAADEQPARGGRTVLAGAR